MGARSTTKRSAVPAQLGSVPRSTASSMARDVPDWMALPAVARSQVTSPIPLLGSSDRMSSSRLVPRSHAAPFSPPSAMR